MPGAAAPAAPRSSKGARSSKGGPRASDGGRVSTPGQQLAGSRGDGTSWQAWVEQTTQVKTQLEADSERTQSELAAAEAELKAAQARRTEAMLRARASEEKKRALSDALTTRDMAVLLEHELAARAATPQEEDEDEAAQ